MIGRKCHFYIGGDLGISTQRAKKTHQILNGAGVALKREIHDLGQFGFTGGGFAGYNYCHPSCFDLGMEIFANGFTTEAKAVHQTSSSGITIPTKLKVTQRYNFGGRVLPGYQFSDKTEGHLILGYTLGGFKLKDSGVYGHVSENFDANGFQIGLGATLGVTRHISFRLDSIYSGYTRHFNSSGRAPSSAEGGPSGGVTAKYQVRVSTVDSTLSLAYGF